jgi:putative transposase
MQKLTYKFRLYPTKRQIALLEWTLDCCRELYNAALQERRDAWRLNRVSVNYCSQAAQLTEIKREREEFDGVYSQVLQEVLRRVDKTFRAFFSRVQHGQKAGYPRFKPASRFDSFTYPQKGFSLRGGALNLSKVGKLKIKLHRPLEGEVKTLTIKREVGRWYACFSVEREAEPLPANDKCVGVDVGLISFATLSDGTEIENPRWFEGARARLRRAQRRVARRKKGSSRRRKAVLMLARLHAHVRHKRADFHHKVSRRLVNEHGLIAVEDLNLKGLAGGMLAKSVGDAGWSSFIEKIAYKAENAGRQFVKVNPKGTSQRCVCGQAVPKTLRERRHDCPACGLSVSRDRAAALEILRLGLSLQALTYPVVECVA